MAFAKKKIKVIFGLLAAGFMLTGSVVGTLIKDAHDKIPEAQPQTKVKQDYIAEQSAAAEKPQMVCSQFLEEFLEKDENTLAFEEYTNVTAVNCMYVGCGGFF